MPEATAEATPAAAPEKPKESFVKVFFDEQGNLKLASEGLTVYAIIGVLRSTLSAIEDKLAQDRSPVPAPAPKAP
jgi:hypothetical protein